MENCLKPFSEAYPNSNLYCINSGKAVPDEIDNNLLSVQQKVEEWQGEKWNKQFEDGCFNHPRRFQRPIPGRKVEHFDVETAKLSCKLKIYEGKGAQIHMRSWSACTERS